MSEAIWIAVCEVLVEPGDLQNGRTKAFAQITTWASSQEAVTDKVSQYLESFNWHLLSVEMARPVEDEEDFNDEIAEMIERTRVNPNAIILGRFFTYPEN